MIELGKLSVILANCPSGGYCIKARRVDCSGCPFRPVLDDKTLIGSFADVAPLAPPEEES